MKRLRTLLLLCTVCISATVAQEVRYKIKKDNPEDVKNFVVHFDPWFADAYFTDVAMGFSARADWLLNKVIDAGVEWRRPYFDMNWLEVDNYKLSGAAGGKEMKEVAFMPKDGFSQYTYFEPSFRLHLSDKIKESNHRLLLSQSSYASGNNSNANTEFINVPGKSRKIFSLQGAACWMNVPVLYEGLFNHDAADFLFEPQDGNATFPAAAGFGGTMMRTITLIGGLSFQRVDNLKILTDRYGVKYSTAWTNFYVDVMYAPVVDFASVIDEHGVEYKVSNQKVDRLGWRLGYNFKNTKGTALSMKLNVGNRPGFTGNNPYFGSRFFMDFNFGVSLASKIKLLPDKKQ